MPLPANGNTEGSASYVCDTSYKTNGQGDCHVLVVEQTENKLYELYNATKSATAFTALGAFVWDLTKAYPDDLRGDQCTSADAAGFPIGALLPTADEVAAGVVKHALRFILPNGSMKQRAYVHPGTHAGSPSSTDPNAPPYGVRFRLKASFSETPFDAGEKVILHAMKTYGMLLSDGGQVALTFADDRTTTAKWAAQGVTALSFQSVTVNQFEVVDLGPESRSRTAACAIRRRGRAPDLSGAGVVATLRELSRREQLRLGVHALREEDCRVELAKPALSVPPERVLVVFGDLEDQVGEPAISKVLESALGIRDDLAVHREEELLHPFLLFVRLQESLLRPGTRVLDRGAVDVSERELEEFPHSVEVPPVDAPHDNRLRPLLRGARPGGRGSSRPLRLVRTHGARSEGIDGASIGSGLERADQGPNPTSS